MSSAGRGQAAVPPPPPPPASSSDEEFDDDDNTDDLLDPVRDAKALAEAEKEAEEERAAHAAFRRRDGTPQGGGRRSRRERRLRLRHLMRAIVESFETLKDDDANARLRQCLLEDEAAHRALAVAREAAKKQTRKRRNDGTGPPGSK
ncbi:hypothetical protein QYE76_024252 [Lolium multiflorum]|uniref:Uncharacterized protein n=1 Tax=Lolium multiflorum TaxID=4521 RepID=A0AAD8RC24_LOLMU|nr:hypothetical protein QYE76_024252 [Lolium multiflorum]